MTSENPADQHSEARKSVVSRILHWIRESIIPLNLFTLLLVVVAGLQTCILNKTDYTLVDTLNANKLAQRAFVFPTVTQIALSPIFISPEAVNFSFSLANNGNAATKNLAFVIKCAVSVEDVDDPWISLVQSRGKFVHEPAVIGPKGAIPIGCSFPIGQVQDMVAKKLFGFILIDITYEDGINAGVKRKTQSALRLSDITYQPSKIEGPSQTLAVFSALAQNRGKHNCADDECSE